MSRQQTVMAAAPWVGAIVLVLIAGWRTISRSPSADTTAYMARVAEKIDGIPYRIGRFIGVDAEVTPGAIELLQPNRILQRRYADPATGEGFSLVIVHCKIAKDMTGHYPPNCYPRAGWVATQPEQLESVTASETVIPARLYSFELQSGFLPPQIKILNFFVLPAGPQRYGAEIRLVDMLSRSSSNSRLGAAQVQVITTAEMDESTRDEIWKETIDVAFPALAEIAGGVR